MDHDYAITMLWSADDQCWIADVPDLNYCAAHGETPIEAMTGVEAAIAFRCDTAREKGMPIPEPCCLP